MDCSGGGYVLGMGCVVAGALDGMGEGSGRKEGERAELRVGMLSILG